MTSNIVITEKYKKLFQTTGIPGTQGEFSDTDAFTDEPVVQCDVQVAENTL